MAQLTLERIVVAPVREDAVLDFLVKALLHAIHVLEFVGLHTPVLALFTSSNGFFEG